MAGERFDLNVLARKTSDLKDCRAEWAGDTFEWVINVDLKEIVWKVAQYRHE